MLGEAGLAGDELVEGRIDLIGDLRQTPHGLRQGAHRVDQFWPPRVEIRHHFPGVGDGLVQAVVLLGQIARHGAQAGDHIAQHLVTPGESLCQC
ncbi:Uncharacterised protein [Mycobacteroides abscessus subsp. massiliense]|nr:Uncharacterised protein [Mycobacteroides abscessus subsp. massiliense]